MEKSLSFLGLAKRAGKIEIGAESVQEAVLKRKAVLILSASDASTNSVKQAKRLAETGKIEHIVLPCEKIDLGEMLGRGLPGMVAVTDLGFASAFVEKLSAETEGRYEDTVKVLKEKAEAEKAARPKPGKRRMNK